METHEVILLTIVAEHVLRERQIAEIQLAGARGYTAYEVEGEGSRHRRLSEVLGSNIKIETIVSLEVANRLLSTLNREYFPKFAAIAYTTIINVVRGEKYV